MKKFALNLLFYCLSLTSYSQAPTLPKIDFTKQSEEYWSNWKKDLYDVGISLQKGSLKVSTEAKKIMQDMEYRNNLYPMQYSWSQATKYLHGMELKKATWFLIKLYTDAANRQMVLQSLASIDRAVEMDRVLISSFYTFALLDPTICTFKNNKVMITRPDVLEKEFSQVKEMVAFIRTNRSKSPGK